jgi:hypothetical protein
VLQYKDSYRSSKLPTAVMPGGGNQPTLNFNGATIGSIYNSAAGGVVQIVDNASKANPKTNSTKKQPPPPKSKEKQPAATSVSVIVSGKKVTVVGGNMKKP